MIFCLQDSTPCLLFLGKRYRVFAKLNCISATAFGAVLLCASVEGICCLCNVHRPCCSSRRYSACFEFQLPTASIITRFNIRLWASYNLVYTAMANNDLARKFSVEAFECKQYTNPTTINTLLNLANSMAKETQFP